MEDFKKEENFDLEKPEDFNTLDEGQETSPQWTYRAYCNNHKKWLGVWGSKDGAEQAKKWHLDQYSGHYVNISWR